MNDATSRPELPDPQHDRHVAFPDLTPAAPAESPSGGPVSAPSTPAPGLPPDAWADHASRSSPPPSSGWQPDPTVLRTPPTRPEPATRRRRPAWLPYAAVIGVFVVMGNAGGHDVVVDAGSGSSEQVWGGSADPWGEQAPDPSTAGWVTTVEDPSLTTDPLPLDSPVSPVPPDTTVLRVEIVSTSAQDLSLTVSTSSGLREESSERTPLAKEIHLGSATSSVSVAASSTDGSGDVLQCRVYAGTDLVAIHTMDTGSVSCELTW